MIKWAVLASTGIALIIGGVMVAMAVATSQPGGSTVVLIGLSPSEKPLGRIIDSCAMDAAAKAIADGATLRVMPIGRVPVELQTKPIRAAVDMWGRMDSSGFQTLQRRLREDARRRIANLRAAEEPDGGSDLIAAASIAADVLADADGPKRLVVCSDAHHVGIINLYRYPLPGCEDLLRPVAFELTRLDGVDVVFATPGADAQHSLSLRHERDIEHFWTSCWRGAVHSQSLTYQNAMTF